VSTATTARDPADGSRTHDRTDLDSSRRDLRTDRQDAAEETAPTAGHRVDPARLPAAIEAVLLASDVPVPADVLADLFGVDAHAVRTALGHLAAEQTAHGHGFGVVAVAGGWRLSTIPEFAPWVERHLGAGQRVRLSRAAVEALTVVAYQQPVTRALVSSVRGVASDGVLRTLVTHGMVEECGTDDSGALRYRTTRVFLEKMGANSLDDLPPLAPHLPDLHLVPDPHDVPEPSEMLETSGLLTASEVAEVAAPVTAEREPQEMP